MQYMLVKKHPQDVACQFVNGQGGHNRQHTETRETGLMKRLFERQNVEY